MSRKKVMDIRQGRHLTVIYIDDRKERNPYRIYNVHDGHRKQIAKYGDLVSVLCFLRDLYRDGADAMMRWEFYQWCEDYHKQ